MLCSDKNILIVIPARYGSKRLPGKPLIKIAGKEMLKRVWEIALLVIQKYKGFTIQALVATDDEKISNFCAKNNINCSMTSVDCSSGTKRTVEIINQLEIKPDFIINLQGDNPLCPPWFLEQMIDKFYKNPQIEVISPYVNLTWTELDELRKVKQKTPFSGTTVVLNNNNEAIWFSKQILPAIRNENKLKTESDLSPVLRHIGLYGYSHEALNTISKLSKSKYEDLEGLEQLSILQAGIKIKMTLVDYKNREGMSGIDEQSDIEIAERILNKFGEFE